MCLCASCRNDVIIFATVCQALLLSACVFAETSYCEQLAAKSAAEDLKTVVHTTIKMLAGTWLSEGCETIPGPEYILRSYTFNENGVYKLTQHRYWDDSCSSPKLTIIANGKIKLKRDPFLNQDSAIGIVDMTNITITPQDKEAARTLDSFVSVECPGQYWKAWRVYDEHVVYDREEKFKGKHMRYKTRTQNYETIVNNHHPLNTPRILQQSSGDLSCLGSLKWAFNELKLLKVQLRPVLDQNLMQLELLLGDVHSKRERREYYTPTAFQTPLIKFNKDLLNVTVNGYVYTIKKSSNLLFTSDNKMPPHLHEKLHLPPYICGDWISTRCEIRPHGLYLQRKFSFYSENSVWIGVHTFYSDSFCSFPKFVITAAGQYVLSETNNILKAATNIDFHIEKATLEILNRKMMHEMKMNGFCGRYAWELGVPQELTSTRGCLQLGLSVPSVQYDVIKVEMDYEGTSLLFMGQADTNNLPRSPSERPTAYQPPLVMCSQVYQCSYDLKGILSDGYVDSNQTDQIHINQIVFLVIILIRCLVS